jgi:hypothetical protein
MFEAIALAGLAALLFFLGCYCGMQVALHDLGDDGPESHDHEKETPPEGWEGQHHG